MIKYSNNKKYAAPGSYSIGEAYACAAISMIMDDAEAFKEVTGGTNSIQQIKDRYRESARNFMNYHEEGMTPFMTFGILWEAVGPDFVGREVATVIANELADPIDAINNDAKWKALPDIAILVTKAGLDKPWKAKETDFTRKIRSCKILLRNKINQVREHMKKN